MKKINYVIHEEGLKRAKDTNREEEFLTLKGEGGLNVNEVLDIMHLRSVWN